MVKVLGEDERVLDELKHIMNEFTEEEYGVTLDIPVEWSTSLKVRWGYFKYKTYSKTGMFNNKLVRKGDYVQGSMKIVINKVLMKATNKELVKNIVKHEALHYALFVLGKPHSDGDEYFQKELKKHGLDNGNISQEMLGITQKYWIWSCSSCGKIVRRGGKPLKKGNYLSMCCDSYLEDNGWMEINPGQKYIGE